MFFVRPWRGADCAAMNLFTLSPTRDDRSDQVLRLERVAPGTSSTELHSARAYFSPSRRALAGSVPSKVSASLFKTPSVPVLFPMRFFGWR